MLWGTAKQISKKVKNQPSKQKHELGSMLLAVSLQSSGRVCETEPSFFESPGELTAKLRTWFSRRGDVEPLLHASSYWTTQATFLLS